MARAYVQWSTWTVRLLYWSTLWMAATGDEVASNAAVKYWEAMLHGGVMPSTIQAMLSPLTSQQTTQLLLDINAYRLPTHAAAFCELAHIQCGPNITNNPFATTETSSDIFGHHYNKDGPKKLPTWDSSPEKLSASNGPLVDYYYNKGDPKKLSASNGPLVDYYYNKGDPKKLHTSADASPRKIHALDDDIFGYHHNKAGPMKLSASDAALLVGPKLKIGGARSLMSATTHEISGSFFREKQVLVSGFKIHVNLATYKSFANDERAFLPRKLAQVFPISNEGVEKISHMLGCAKESLQVTVDQCNAGNNMSGEVSTCLASVEDISYFVSSIMGSTKTINAYESIRNARTSKFMGKTFIVDSVKPLKKDIDEPAITCHDMNFPFRVFYCHYALKTKIFNVKLQGEDGTSHERLAVCHYDTTYWNPEHVSFSELHTKPGEVEACHWLGQSGWVFSYA